MLPGMRLLVTYFLNVKPPSKLSKTSQHVCLVAASFLGKASKVLPSREPKWRAWNASRLEALTLKTLALNLEGTEGVATLTHKKVSF